MFVCLVGWLVGCSVLDCPLQRSIRSAFLEESEWVQCTITRSFANKFCILYCSNFFFFLQSGNSGRFPEKSQLRQSRGIHGTNYPLQFSPWPTGSSEEHGGTIHRRSSSGLFCGRPSWAVPPWIRTSTLWRCPSQHSLYRGFFNVWIPIAHGTSVSHMPAHSFSLEGTPLVCTQLVFMNYSEFGKWIVCCWWRWFVSREAGIDIFNHFRCRTSSALMLQSKGIVR